MGKASYNRKISKKRGRLVEDPLIMPPIVEFTSETTREKEWDNIAAIHEGKYETFFKHKLFVFYFRNSVGNNLVLR